MPTDAPILILSHPRSGSTLLRYLLDTHPAIASPAELRLGALCHDLLRISDFTIGQLRTGLPEAERRRLRAQESRTIVDTIMGRYSEAKGKRRWCEKTPSNVDYLPALLTVLPDAKYICLHRHCLDTVVSCFEMRSDQAIDYMREYITRQDGDITAGFVERWCHYAAQLIELERDNHRSALRVRYEDLVRAPSATMKQITDFVEVDAVDDLEDLVFKTSHEAGMGDPKIVGSAVIESGRIGRGAALDIGTLTDALRARLRATLQALGYDDQPMTPAAPHSRTAVADKVTSVEQLFGVVFPERLARANFRWGRDWSIRFVVTGARPTEWHLRVGETATHLTATPAAAPDFVVTIEGDDLLRIVNREMTMGEALYANKLRVNGDVTPDIVGCANELAWVLFRESDVKRSEAAP